MRLLLRGAGKQMGLANYLHSARGGEAYAAQWLAAKTEAPQAAGSKNRSVVRLRPSNALSSPGRAGRSQSRRRR